MSISAGQVVLHEASTSNRLQLPFSRVPELVRRCVMNEHRKPKWPWHLHFRHHRRSKGNARSDTQVDFSNSGEGPPAHEGRADHVPGVRMLRNVVFRTEQVGHLIASLPRRCLL